MVNLYCTLIINKRRTFDSVPANMQPAVEERLREKRKEKNGDHIVSEEA